MEWSEERAVGKRKENCKGPQTGASSECPRNNRRPGELGHSEQHRVRPDLRSKSMQGPWVLVNNPCFYSLLAGAKYKEDMTRIRV